MLAPERRALSTEKGRLVEFQYRLCVSASRGDSEKGLHNRYEVRAVVPIYTDWEVVTLPVTKNSFGGWPAGFTPTPSF